MATVKIHGGVTLEAPDELFPIQRELFIEEFLIDFDSARAAKAVGIRGHNLAKLADTSIREDIKARYEERFGSLGARAFRVTSEITKLAFSDSRQLFDESGRLVPIHLLPDHISASIASVDVTKRVISSGNGVDETEYVTKIRLHDKLKALQTLAKQLGLISDINITNINNVNNINGANSNSTIPLEAIPIWLKCVIVQVIQGGNISSDLETRIMSDLAKSIVNNEPKEIEAKSKPETIDISMNSRSTLTLISATLFEE